MASTSSSSSSGNAGDSYIGSFISLISKYEIRYEGVLFRLSIEDSSIGLKNVRSFGTEGRRKDGPQIPPSDKVYEFILFRGSDIKDLQVKSTPPVQSEEHIHHDPAIIQSHYTGVTPSSSPLTSVSGKTLTESAQVQSNPAEMSRVYSGVLPSYQSAGHVGPTIASQTNQNTVPSFSSSMYWQGYNGTSIAGLRASEQSVAFQPQFVGSSPLPVQSPMSAPLGLNDSPIMGLTNASASLASLPYVASSPVNISFMPPSPVEPAMPSSPSMITTFLPADPSYTTANRLIKSSVALPSQDAGTVEAPTIAKAVFDSATLNPTFSMPSTASTSVGSISSSLLPVPPSLLSLEQKAHSRLLPSMPMVYHDQRDASSAHSGLLPSMPMVYHDQRDASALTPLPSTSVAVISAPTLQEPLLPLPRSVQKFTEEFDFEAMNEKFKKDEVWGYLGKAKQIDRAEGAIVDATDQSLEGSPGQPAYKKDEFFDTISRNSQTRGRYGQNRFSERMKQDTETFGNFRQSNQGYGNYGAGHGNNYNGRQNWGRGYGYGGRARGGMQY